MRTLIAAIDRTSTALASFASGLLLLMTAIAALNAVARYGGRWAGVNLTSNALLEAQWYLFAAVFLLAAPATLLRDKHVRVDVWYARRSARTRGVVDVVGTLLFLLPVCAFGAVSAWPAVRQSWAILEQSSDPGGLPRYPVKTLVPVALVLLAVQGLALLPRHLAAARGAEPGAPS